MALVLIRVSLLLDAQHTGGVHAMEGYNFEDAILISEKMIKDDIYLRFT